MVIDMRKHRIWNYDTTLDGLLQGVDLYKIHKTILYNLPIAIVFSMLFPVELLQICFVDKTILRFVVSLNSYLPIQ